MEIKLHDGTKLDTNKLSDKESEIAEAIDKLYKLCEQYNVTAFCRVIIDSKRFIGMNRLVKQPEVAPKDYRFLMEAIHTFVNETSDGKISLTVKTDEDETSSSE